MLKLNIQDLFDAGAHLGHKIRRWNPKMKAYVYKTMNGIHIFDLRITMQQMADSCDFIYDIVANGGKVIFVGTKQQAQESVQNAAEATDMFYMTKRWFGGTLTNYQTICKGVTRMKKLQSIESDTIEKMPKKEASSLRRELNKLTRNFQGISSMDEMPQAMIVIDIEHEAIAVKEALRMDIPVVALVDSSSDPQDVHYVVPGNDDAVRVIKLIVDTFIATIQAAKDVYEKKCAAAEKEKESKEAVAKGIKEDKPQTVIKKKEK